MIEARRWGHENEKLQNILAPIFLPIFWPFKGSLLLGCDGHDQRDIASRVF
jgi:hypothetical protein